MKELLRIAWRNIGRNKRRSLLTALAVGFAVLVLSFSMALQQGSYAEMIANTVRARTGHLQVQHPHYWPDQQLSDTLSDPEAILKVIGNLPHVVGAAPRVNAAALVSRADRTFGALILGVDPDRESQVSSLARLLSAGTYLHASDPDGAMVGATLATNLKAGLNDEIVFLGQGADGSIAARRLTVRGLFQSGFSELDRAALAAPLPTIQEAFSLEGRVSEVAILLDEDRARPSTAAELRERLTAAGITNAAVLGWPILLPGVQETIRLDWYSGLIVYALLVVVVGFGITNTFLMAFMERLREFGVLLSLGLKPWRLFLLVYLESVLLILQGIALGLAGAIGLVGYLQERGINFGADSEAILTQYGLSPVIHPQLSCDVLGSAVGIVLIAGLVLALYPAWKAGRLRPVPAMRQR